MTTSGRLASHALRLLLLPMLLSPALANAEDAPAKLPARKVLASTILEPAQIDAVLAGATETVEIVSESTREIGVALACLIPAGRRASLAAFRDDPQIVPEAFRDAGEASGPIAPDDVAGSLAVLTLGDGAAREAERYLSVEPGYTLNLSLEEMADFRSLLPPEGREIEDVEAEIRRAYAARIEAYRQEGLGGIAPFARGDGESHPSEELTRTTGASAPLARVFPELRVALQAFPNEAPPGGEERYFWTRLRVRDRPVFLLHQRLATAPGDDSQLVVERQFYASSFLDVGQTIVGLVPVEEGKLFFYVNRTWIDRWSGPEVPPDGEPTVGKDIVHRVLGEVTKRADFCR